MSGERPDGLLTHRRASDTAGRPAPATPRRPRRRRLGRRRRRPLVWLTVLALLALLGGGWLWVRDSSLVAVDHVTVTGESGPDAAQIRSALVAEAHNMTTLDVRMDELRTAVAPYPVVKDLSVRTQFPHGMRIRVIEQVPVAVVVAPGSKIAVASDGTLLRDVVPSAALPTILLRVAPGGTHLTGYLLGEVSLLAAAPDRLLAQVSQVSTVAPHGLVAQLRNGPIIYFGDSTQLATKWMAASRVLSTPNSAGAVYIDVTVPQRPAAGAISDTSAASGTGTVGAGAAAGGSTAG